MLSLSPHAVSSRSSGARPIAVKYIARDAGVPGRDRRLWIRSQSAWEQVGSARRAIQPRGGRIRLCTVVTKLLGGPCQIQVKLLYISCKAGGVGISAPRTLQTQITSGAYSCQLRRLSSPLPRVGKQRARHTVVGEVCTNKSTESVSGPRFYASALIRFISLLENAPRGRRVEAGAPAACVHSSSVCVRNYLGTTASLPRSCKYDLNFALARGY